MPLPLPDPYIGDEPDLPTSLQSIQRNFDAIARALGELKQFIFWGEGDPENVVVANIGSIFLRLDGGASTTLYVKEADSGADTGWQAK